MTAKTVRSVVEDCYKSREVIGGADKWNELIDQALDQIREAMPSEQELTAEICRTQWINAMKMFQHKEYESNPIDRVHEVATAIRELIESKLQ